MKWQLVMMGAVTALSLSSVAHADDKYLPGAICQGGVFESATRQSTVFGTGELGGYVSYVDTWYRPALYQPTGTAMNGSLAAEMTLSCPVVRDTVRSDGLGWSYLYVNALNLSNSRTLTCAAATFSPNDYGNGAWVSSRSLAPNTGWTDLSFSAVPMPSSGYIFVTCTIPRQDAASPSDWPSGIASIRYDE